MSGKKGHKLGSMSKESQIREAAQGWATTEREYDYWVPEMDIDGVIPEELLGTFIRNGPGIAEVYDTKLAHPIDGDGMVCALSFMNGKCHFRSKFVQTRHRLAEEHERRYIYRGQMGTTADSVLKGTVSTLTSLITNTRPTLRYRNPSNTNSFYWGGKILTCYETGPPYALDPHTLTTLGPDNLRGTLSLGVLAAHFRLDAKQNRLVTISLRPGLDAPAKLEVNEFDPEWNLQATQKLKIEGLNYAHDFLLSDSYYLFHMTPFVKLTKALAMKIVAGLTSPGESMHYYPDLPSRIVLIERHPRRGASPKILQFDTDPCHIFHFGDVEERGSKVKFQAVCLDEGFNMEFQHNVWLSNADASPGRLYTFEVDIASGACTRTLADSASCEFPVVHPYRHGQGCQFSYLMACATPGRNLPYQDVVKADATTSTVDGGARHVYHTSGYVGEPCFVPRLGPQSEVSGDEDDGWVLVQEYQGDTRHTHFVILDAKDLSEVARIRLRHHVTYGFHGTFTPNVFIPPQVHAHL